MVAFIKFKCMSNLPPGLSNAWFRHVSNPYCLNNAWTPLRSLSSSPAALAFMALRMGWHVGGGNQLSLSVCSNSINYGTCSHIRRSTDHCTRSCLSAHLNNSFKTSRFQVMYDCNLTVDRLRKNFEIISNLISHETFGIFTLCVDNLPVRPEGWGFLGFVRWICRFKISLILQKHLLEPLNHIRIWQVWSKLRRHL